MTRATALFLLCYPIKEEFKTISLENGRKLGCRRNSDEVYTIGTFRHGPLYEWFNLTPKLENGKITNVLAVDEAGNPDSDGQNKWESYAETIVDLLSESRKKKLKKMTEA